MYVCIDMFISKWRQICQNYVDSYWLCETENKRCGSCILMTKRVTQTNYYDTLHCDKKILRHLTIFSNKFLLNNQGKLLKTLIYLGLKFVQSIPWLFIENHGSKLSISFYCNIVGKNIKCVQAINVVKIEPRKTNLVLSFTCKVKSK